MSASLVAKNNDVEVSQLPANSGTSPSSESHLDTAWKFLDSHRDVAGGASSPGEGRAAGVDINALRRKIDWHILPLMFLCYTMQFLDKVTLNVCAAILSSSCCCCSAARCFY